VSDSFLERPAHERTENISSHNHLIAAQAQEVLNFVTLKRLGHLLKRACYIGITI